MRPKRSKEVTEAKMSPSNLTTHAAQNGTSGKM